MELSWGVVGGVFWSRCGGMGLWNGMGYGGGGGVGEKGGVRVEWVWVWLVMGLLWVMVGVDG